MNKSTGNQKSILWAETCLKKKGYLLQSQFIPVSTMPWSTVHQVRTSMGILYLKQPAQSFAIEANLLRFLSQFHPNFLPKVIDNNQDLGCFLMADAGVSLRHLLQQDITHILLAGEALSNYATIQQGLVGQMESLFSLGVPDWQLENLPSLYLNLLKQEKFLIIDGLSAREIATLRDSLPQVASLCQQLTSYNIPQTIEHSDFHDNNILYKAPFLTVTDWGEAVITHPFFSLISFFISLERQHQLDKANEQYNKLRDIYLDHWSAFETKNRLVEAFDIVKRLGPIKYALSFYRVTQCPGWSESGQNQGRISSALKRFLQSEG